jgi:uncharacterized metal-binding protein YceD (DUF177 family)
MPAKSDRASHSPPAMAPPLRVARLARNAPTEFDIRPDAEARRALAAHLGIDKLRKLRLVGHVAPLAGGGWELRAELGATVVQSCVVTLEPVTTRIDEPVQRRYLPDLPAPPEGEAEMPEDADCEPLGEVIDPAAVMVEALALALPPFPRAEGAELGEAVYTAPGDEPMRDEDTRPLAGLAALRDKLKQ